MLPEKNLDDIHSAWNSICTKLGTGGKDLHTLSNRPGAEQRWFHASVSRDCVFIERAGDPSKNSKISGIYPIRYQEFALLAPYYNDYAMHRPNEIRRTDSHMSSYIITLIAELL